jgi:Family of unknown function (DUF6114)
MANNVPKTAVVLTIVGGFFILLGGVAMLYLGAIVSLFLPRLAGLFVIGLGLGLLTIVMAVLMLVAPQLKAAWGALTIVFAVLSIPFALVGGFLLGFILALIGGILAITYKPPVVAVSAPYAPAYPMASPPPPPSS